MSPTSRFVLLSLVSFAATPFASAQNVLLVENNGRPVVVERFQKAIPLIRDRDTQEFKAAPSLRYALKKVDGYRPLFIAVRNMKMGGGSMEIIGDVSIAPLNHELRFEADFEAAENLDHVFMAIELRTERFGRSYVAYEVGPLRARQPRRLRFVAPISTDFGQGKYELHLFADGYEVFHSKMPAGKMDKALDADIARRITGIETGGLEPFLQTAPEYPVALVADGTAGSATMAFTVDQQGRVQNPKVDEATHPAFGAAALAAIRQWRFSPQVVAGKPVAAKARIPFVFQPPEK